jgi:hypothetical protein
VLSSTAKTLDFGLDPQSEYGCVMCRQRPCGEPVSCSRSPAECTEEQALSEIHIELEQNGKLKKNFQVFDTECSRIKEI